MATVFTWMVGVQRTSATPRKRVRLFACLSWFVGRDLFRFPFFSFCFLFCCLLTFLAMFFAFCFSFVVSTKRCSSTHRKSGDGNRCRRKISPRSSTTYTTAPGSRRWQISSTRVCARATQTPPVGSWDPTNLTRLRSVGPSVGRPRGGQQ